MPTRRQVLGWGAAGLVAGGGAAGISYRRDMDAARARVAPGLSEMAPTRFGAMEFAEAGEGPPFLMIHGTGGGFDQGLDFAASVTAAGFRTIAPSRFGYLRTPMPDDPSLENQADALAELLDHLEIDRLPVAGGSAGAQHALQFALRHPDRVSAVIALVPASWAPNRPPPRPWTRSETFMARNVLGSDFLFWALSKAAPGKMIETILATDPALLATASADEAARVRGILTSILPVSERAAGLLNDGAQAGNPTEMPLERIGVPTLAISCEDDRYDTARAARHIAATVPGARAVIYPEGGHVWVGHQDDVTGEMVSFLREVAGR